VVPRSMGLKVIGEDRRRLVMSGLFAAVGDYVKSKARFALAGWFAVRCLVNAGRVLS
jgi:hypothetical protein